MPANLIVSPGVPISLNGLLASGNILRLLAATGVEYRNGSTPHSPNYYQKHYTRRQTAWTSATLLTLFTSGSATTAYLYISSIHMWSEIARRVRLSINYGPVMELFVNANENLVIAPGRYPLTFTVANNQPVDVNTPLATAGDFIFNIMCHSWVDMF